MKQNSLLGYNVFIFENKLDIHNCWNIIKDIPISVVAFDTETNTPIDMQKKDKVLIDIIYDKPFLIQFGFGNSVYMHDCERYPELTDLVRQLFDKICQKSALVTAHNIKFDINMLMNIGFDFSKYNNLYDNMGLMRLTLESKTDKEGGMSLKLKTAATRMLGSMYSDADKEIGVALQSIWSAKLKQLTLDLKNYKYTKKKVVDLLKELELDDTVTIEPEVLRIYENWKKTSYITYADVDRELMYRYGAVDVIILLKFADMLLPILKDRSQLDVFKREMQLIMPLVRMERVGYTINTSYLYESRVNIVNEIKKIYALNKKIIGIDIRASQHVLIKSSILDKFGYVLKSTDKNNMHIDIIMDETMPDEVKQFLNNIMTLRTLEKWLSVYVEAMIFRIENSKSNKVYTSYNPNGAVSGRFTSNFQQFPKNAIVSTVDNRELFHPRKMFIVSEDYPETAYVDYSQIELRLQAEYTYYCTGGLGDINMLRAYMPFKCDADTWEAVDLHTQSTQKAFPDVDINSSEFKKLRNVGKRVNFALIYGAGLPTVQSTLSDTPKETVSKLFYGFHNSFPDVKMYSSWVQQFWARNGYAQNLLGRRYYITDSSSIYKLNNYLIQGSAADIIKLAIINIDKMLIANNYKSKLQGCIHDEVIVAVAPGEFEEVIPKVKKLMEDTCKTFVPLIAEVELTNTNWAEKKEVCI